MFKHTFHLLLWANFLLCLTSYQSPKAVPANQQQINNLTAFAKLYGYIRYFHPSDQASSVDWDRFVYQGVGKVKQAPNDQALKKVLEELFLPIAPTVHFYTAGQKPALPTLVKEQQTNPKKVLAWQHKGVAFKQNPVYKSIRINRENKISGSTIGFGTIIQVVEAAPYLGKEIKLTAFVKTSVTGTGNQGHLWLRVDKADRQVSFFDNMDNRPILSKEWQAFEITGKIDQEAKQIVFGAFLKGTGQLWVDDFTLSVKNAKGEWEGIPLNNAGFEESNAEKGPKDWQANTPGYKFIVDQQTAHSGNQSLAIETQTISLSEPLFEQVPALGEMIDKPLAGNLYCLLPLSLPAQRSSPAPATVAPTATQATTAEMSGGDLYLTNVILSWNVFQHFYPYFDVVKANWEEVLSSTLAAALTDKTDSAFYYTLSKMVAKLEDGHGNVVQMNAAKQGILPFKADWIEQQLVVVATADSTLFNKGDIIESLDGQAARKLLEESEEYISGSPQWRRAKATSRFGMEELNTSAKVKLTRNGKPLEVQAKRGEYFNQLEEYKRQAIEQVEGGIYYVNLMKASMEEIEKKIADIAQAKGVVFDLRGYPNRNHGVISYLIDSPVESARWMVAQTIYPDREKLAGYDTSGRWRIEPLSPKIKGKVIFLTNCNAISYAESFMGIIEHYKLAEIIGQPTAGANGNVNPFSLPGGYTIVYTGMKVLKHDGSQHHLLGIQPTLAMERTIKAVREGKDEYLLKAIERINQP